MALEKPVVKQVGIGVFFAEAVEAVYPGSGGFSAEAWVKAGRASDGVIASSGECCGVTRYWTMATSLSDGKALLYGRLNDGGGEISGVGSRNLADGKWHHVALVRERRAGAGEGRITGFVDGAQEFEFPDSTGEISDFNTAVFVGSANPEQNEWFEGSVAGVKMVPRALSATEVAGSYNSLKKVFEQL